MGVFTVFKERRELTARVSELELEKRDFAIKLVALADDYDKLLGDREKVVDRRSSELRAAILKVRREGYEVQRPKRPDAHQRDPDEN